VEEQIADLLELIYQYKDKDDLVHVGIDSNNHTQQVLDIIKYFNITPVYFVLDSFKTQFNSTRPLCRQGQIIFGLCPDELPSINLLTNVRQFFENDSDLDMLAVPRINTFVDLTPESANQMYTGPRKQTYLLEEPINSFGWHHWPDYQRRIIRNVPYINLGPDAHSGLVGYKKIHYLHQSEEWALRHTKTIAHQERMLKIYDNLH
jgi:hypothetical protein